MDYLRKFAPRVLLSMSCDSSHSDGLKLVLTSKLLWDITGLQETNTESAGFQSLRCTLTFLCEHLMHIVSLANCKVCNL